MLSLSAEGDNISCSDLNRYAVAEWPASAGVRLFVKDSTVTGIEVWDYPERTVSRRLWVEAVPAILARTTHSYPDGSCSVVVKETEISAAPLASGSGRDFTFFTYVQIW